MAEQWWAVYEVASGRLVSLGSIETTDPQELQDRRVAPMDVLNAKGLTKVALAEAPSEAIMWDEGAKVMVARPWIDAVVAFFDDAEIAVLSSTLKERIEVKLLTYFGLRRRT